jgi:F0F1-type ATP synthase assembly protein I
MLPPPYVPLEHGPPNKTQASVDKRSGKQDSLPWIIGGLIIGMMLGVFIGFSTPDPKGAIPLGLFGALLGAVIAKLISTAIQRKS